MSEPTRLIDLAKTIRSKNAGVDAVTFDIFFPESESFRRVVDSKALTPETVVELYKTDKDHLMTFLELEDLKAIKFTIRRDRPSGSPGDADVFGSQQYAPLLTVSIPE